MSVGLDHPLVSGYLAELDAAASVLGQTRRFELVDELRSHIQEALQSVGEDDASVRGVLDRLGDPQDIVAAETESIAPQPPPAALNAGHLAAEPFNAPTAVTEGRGWGPIEVGSVFALTVGQLFVVVGPLIGVGLAWMSKIWTRRQKVIATVVGLIPLLLVALSFLLFFPVRTEVNTYDVSPAQPVVSVEVPPDVQSVPSP